ncbi:restriction endonuclease [Halobacillus fulvus]|nr:restriction endonuclease [Halobacillus fulvus]
MDPFVRLKNDGVWFVTPDIDHRKSFSRKMLLEQNVQGGFTDEVASLFIEDPSLIMEAAHMVLDNHFPDTYHSELLQAVGLNVYAFRRYKKRDPEFRKKVLSAYNERCAVCGFQAKINDAIVGVEAAHIKWHQASGPDTEENGLALCSLHHKLFDKGIFTVKADRMIEVSGLASGMGPYKELVTDYHQKFVRKPSSLIYLPDEKFMNWHVREVYKGVACSQF